MFTLRCRVPIFSMAREKRKNIYINNSKIVLISRQYWLSYIFYEETERMFAVLVIAVLFLVAFEYRKISTWIINND